MSKGVYYTMGLNSAGFMSGAQTVQSMLARLDQSVNRLAVAAQRMNLSVRVTGTDQAANELSRTTSAVQRLKSTFQALSSVGSGITNIVSGVQSARQGVAMLQNLANSGGRAGNALKGATSAAQRFASMLRTVSWQKLIAGAAAATVAITGVVVAYRAASLAARGGAAALSLPFKAMAASARTAAGAVRATGMAVTGALSAGFTAMLSPIGLAIGAVGALTAAFKALSLGADFEQMSVGMNTILKNAQATAGLLGQIQKFAAANGQSMFDSAKGARALLGGGFGVGEVMPMLKMMGDVAAGAQTDIGGLILVLNQVKGKGKFYAEELQQFAERGVTGLREALAKVRGTSIEQLSKDMEDGKLNVTHLIGALQQLTSAGGMFHNAMANQSKTTLGLIATVKSKVQELILVFSSPTNDTFKPLLANLITGLDKAIVKAKTFMGALAIAAKNGKLGELLYDYLKMGLAKAGNYMVKVFSGAMGTIKGFFTELTSSGFFDKLGSALSHTFQGAAASLAAAMFKHLREINNSLPAWLRSDDSKLSLNQVDAERDAGYHKRTASSMWAGVSQSIDPAKLFQKAVAGGKSGFENAPKLFDETPTTLVKDAETASRIERNNKLMEEKKALEKVTSESKNATSNLNGLSNSIGNAKTAFNGLKSALGGGDSGGSGDGTESGGRSKIVTMSAAQSAARRFMRLSPAAQKYHDGSFDAHFGGKKKTPEEMAQSFFKSDMGGARALDEMKRKGKGAKGFGSMNEILKTQPAEFFRGLPGTSSKQGNGTSMLEKLLGDVLSELKGVKTSLDSIQTA